MTLEGEPYYSWDENKYPNWFSAQSTFWNEARRNRLVNDHLPDLIYHYTSIEGFLGIVQSRNIWLSDYSYLNDKRELSHGIDLVAEVAKDMLQAEKRASARELLQGWIKDLEQPTHRVCIASFSGHGDSLSQWRAYGPVAIGLAAEDVAMHAYRGILRPVEYVREKQRALAQIFMHHMREAFVVDSEANRLERIENVYKKTDRFIELLSFFKDPAFASEQEYRLTFIEYPGLMQSFGHKPSPKRFRVAKGRILPYVLSSELEPTLTNYDPPLRMREIVLGPEADDLLERGVRELLSEQGYGEVNVRRSSIPYRT